MCCHVESRRLDWVGSIGRDLFDIWRSGMVTWDGMVGKVGNSAAWHGMANRANRNFSVGVEDTDMMI